MSSPVQHNLLPLVRGRLGKCTFALLALVLSLHFLLLTQHHHDGAKVHADCATCFVHAHALGTPPPDAMAAPVRHDFRLISIVAAMPPSAAFVAVQLALPPSHAPPA